MSEGNGYILGQSPLAARRLELQDSFFAEPSERLLDELALRPSDRVTELGCGPGSFSKRVLRRLGQGGVLVGVDASEELLSHAKTALAQLGPARFETVLADAAQLGTWLEGADAVVGRLVLHHIPMVEFMLGRLRTLLPPGTRVGFLEPDFRIPLAQLGYLEAGGRSELAPLRVWITALNELFLLSRISLGVAATLGQTLQMAGYRNVRSQFTPNPIVPTMLENMIMVYDEVRAKLVSLGIMTAAQIAEQQHMLATLPADNLPAVWGSFYVACET